MIWDWLSNGVAILALAVSVWSVMKTNAFNKRQDELSEITEKLSKAQLERENSELLSSLKADISANFVKIGANHRLKVFNRGKSTARNVRLENLDAGELIPKREIDRKFPMPILEQHQSIELIAFVHMSSPTRAHIRLTWDDDQGKDNVKELTPAI